MIKVIKKVYKYSTGQEIPKRAVYLCTKTETEITKSNHGKDSIVIKRNLLVWHYFLVEVKK